MSVRKLLYFVSICAIVAILQSCNDKPSYPENSILGGWRCLEDGAVHGFRQYSVSIDANNDNPSFITILNFYNLGFDVETYATVVDTVITIYGTNSIHDFNGTGHFERDFSAIYWKFSYFGMSGTDPQVESAFRRY